jgi:hypothetical protein
VRENVWLVEGRAGPSDGVVHTYATGADVHLAKSVVVPPRGRAAREALSVQAGLAGGCASQPKSGAYGAAAPVMVRSPFAFTVVEAPEAWAVPPQPSERITCTAPALAHASIAVTKTAAIRIGRDMFFPVRIFVGCPDAAFT